MSALLTGLLLLALLVLVLAPALRELFWPTDVAPLNVPRNHDNAAARFADNYRARLEQTLSAPLPAALLRPDAAARTAQLGLHWCAPGHQVSQASLPLVGAGDLSLPPDFQHRHEVYAAGDLVLGRNALARAAYAEGDLRLDAGARVTRWAHARHVVLGSGSQVGARVTASQSILLAPGARFLRARAPTIAAAADASTASPVSTPRQTEARQRFNGGPGVHRDEACGRWRVPGTLSLPPGTEVNGDLIVRGDADLGANCVVHGSLKVHGRLALGPGCVIDGACVVTGTVRVGANVLMAGPLIGEAQVHIGPAAIIGRPDAQTSVNGQLVALAPAATVHGSIWAKVDAGALK